MQRFKPKRRLKKIALFKTILLIVITIILFKFITNLFSKHKNLVVKTMFLDEKYSFDKKNSNIFTKVYEFVGNNIINNPTSMLVNNIEYNNSLPNKSKDESVIALNNTNKNDDNALIYIYNSHQKESYSKDYMEDYNINPDVFLASHIMQEKLNSKGIKTIVMEDDITAYLDNNSLDYSYSYVASRYYLKGAIENYPTVKLFIDLHRDSTTKDISTITINSKSYAKVMFVVGKEYDTYKQNLELSNYLNGKIENSYPNLSRGVLEKEGYGVNGVYNQDLKSNIILIELGGDKNNIEEVTNTIDILVEILGEYVHE